MHEFDPLSRTSDPSTASAPPLEAPPRAEPAPGRSRRLAAFVVAASVISAIAASTITAGVARELAGSATVPPSTATPNAVTASSGSAAPAPTAASLPSGGRDPIVAVARVATPSVVTIESRLAGAGRFGRAASGTGSGFVVDGSGLVLTNAHVVEGAESLTVTFLDGRQFPGTLVASDASLDLAVVRIDASGLAPLALGSGVATPVGETVIAIGSPLGTFTGSVTSGVLSATGRTITVSDELTGRSRTLRGLLQTDAAINPGNSGGPILDLAGRVVGIATATSANAEGLGFAVPIGEAAAILAQARRAAA